MTILHYLLDYQLAPLRLNPCDGVSLKGNRSTVGKITQNEKARDFCKSLMHKGVIFIGICKHIK